MKQMISLLLSLVMVLALVACSDTTVSTHTPTSSSTTAPAQKPSAEMLEEFSKTATIEETIMVDEDDVRIIATTLDYNDYSAELELTIENNSKKNLCFTSGTLGYSCNSVNGMMVADGYLNCDVAAGKKAMDTISLSYASLQLYGIQEIADIEIGFCAIDENYNYTYFTPRQVTTSASGNYDYSQPRYQETISGTAAQNTFNYEVPFFATDRLYEKSGVAVLSQALIRNSDSEVSLLLEVENQTQDMRIISVSNIVINNLLVNGSNWCKENIAPGKRGIIAINLSSVLDERYMELYGIENIGSIGFDLQQFDIDLNKITEQEAVSIKCADVSPVKTSGEELYNQNGVRIVAKTVLEPASEYDSYFNVLLLAENNSNDIIELNIPFKDLSVNGFMVDYYGSVWELQPGQYALMEIQLSKRDLEQIKVTEANQITQVEFTLKINQGETLLDESKIILNLDNK